jgi:hypothetical protein
MTFIPKERGFLPETHPLSHKKAYKFGKNFKLYAFFPEKLSLKVKKVI